MDPVADSLTHAIAPRAERGAYAATHHGEASPLCKRGDVSPLSSA